MCLTKVLSLTTFRLALVSICMISSALAQHDGSHLDGEERGRGARISADFVTIDFPGASFTEASAINPAGEIVGTFLGLTGEHGFLLNKDVFTTIDDPVGFATSLLGINPEGDIVGSYNQGPSPGTHGFLLSKGRFVTIDFPGALFTFAFGINPKGQIVGYYGDGTTEHGFLL
jgi:uncharacterized membrane protein